MASLLRDLRFGLKLLVRDRAFSLTVLLTLGVCVGANIGIFSSVDAVVLRPLPFERPDQLVTMYNIYPDLGVGREQAANSPPDFSFRRERVAGLEEVAAFRGSGNTVGEPDGAERVSSLRATPSFLPMLGVSALLGRTFLEEEMEPGQEQTVLLTYGYWQEEFGASTYITLPGARYPDDDARRRFAEQFLTEIRTLPGVTGAGTTTQLPFGPGGGDVVIRPEGYEPPPGESLVSPRFAVTAPGYFDAMGIEILEGRTFQERDGSEQPRVIIIDEWLARRYWPDRSPLGQRMTRAVPGMEVEEEDFYTVIGVVETIKHNDLTAAEPEHVGAYYFTYQQFAVDYLGLVVRTEPEPATLAGSIRAALARLDPELPLFDVQSLEDRIMESLGSLRTSMVLLVVFAAVALFLAMVGIYGVLAYSVAQRTREIGIRLALGGNPISILRLVLKQGLVLTGVGLAAGAVAAFFIVRLIHSLLFGVQPMDPLVLAGTAVLLGLAALVACMIPARRATRVDPVITLAEG